jgi:hypothetical protein
MWAAVLDGAIAAADIRQSKALAEADARWLRGHPACADRRRFGHGGIVRVIQLVQCELTGDMIEAGT